VELDGLELALREGWAPVLGTLELSAKQSPVLYCFLFAR